MSWKIKQKPEDFVVTEVIFDKTEESWKEKYRKLHGKTAETEKRYLWFTLKKTGRDFFEVMAAIGLDLKIGTRDLGYSGTKDKNAVTIQTVSVPIEKEEDVRKLDIKGVEISDFRHRNRPIRLGEHKGNNFEIVVRNIEKDDIEAISKRIEDIKTDGMINYFGEQRFGSLRKVNDEIGRLLVHGELEQAAKRIIDEVGGYYGKRMSAFLRKHPHHYRGALKQMPLRLLKLFIHAYQSKIWNECAIRYNGENTVIPIIGYATDLRNYPKVREIAEGVLDEEKTDRLDFKNYTFKELSSRGAERPYLVFPENLEYKFGNDELNKGKRKMTLKFYLPKGSYATELIRQLEQA